MQNIVVDTGPLVAYFDRRDKHHAVVLRWFERFSAGARLLCTEAVVTEVTHLLDFHIETQTAFVRWAGEMMHIQPLPVETYATLALWMDDYANVPMDFADAAVLWLYRENAGSKILTLDRRGFGVFRLPGHGKKVPSVVRLE